MDRHEQFERALSVVQARRAAAVAENQRRTAEISLQIPQIAEISRQLADTAKDIFRVIQSGEQVEEQLAQIRLHNEERQSLLRDLLVKNGYAPDYLDLHYSCEKCDDTGYCGNENCACLNRELSRIAAAELNRHAQLALSSFSDFSLDYYRSGGASCYETMERILQFCRGYAANFSLSSPSLLMMGMTGLGKTHLSLAIANEVIAAGHQVIYDSVINLLHTVEREHFGRSEGNTLETLLGCELLIIDDLGAEFDSGFYVSTVYNIINTRLNRGLPTIISTNLTHEAVQKKYEERIVSRLFACYTCLQFQGKDVRMQIQIEKQSRRR
ncbi:MAG: DNA replication protein DnaC [Ruminococcus sp.]|nr:DNA replication protein DnaC [Ruminococcus sp.]